MAIPRCLVSTCIGWMLTGAAASASEITAPPMPVREMRATWIATVRNVNWPSEPGLPVAKQKAQLEDLINKAAELRLNAIVFQVRPAGDAMYRSSIEPWSPFLMGKMGQAPDPLWDPLEFAVEKAHAHGIELHAWFNPFRAIATTASHTPAGTHICKEHPDWTMRYGIDTWMDPGEPGVRSRSIAVILDVLRRYDVDGIHIDDYFYPYPIKGGDGNLKAFPDDATYARYKAAGGALDLNAWRRSNIDTFIEETYRAIKTTKRWVKFGISPFGLWRPNVPAGTGGGLDPYEELGADSLKWLQKGWLDYLVPQLYWPIDPQKLSFTTFYDWWLSQNTLGRHIWPGMADDRIGSDRGPGEILRQISAVRERGRVAAPGHFHWNFGILASDKGKIGTLTKQRAYQLMALPPATPWLSQIQMPQPQVQVTSQQGKRSLTWGFTDPRWLNAVRWWVLQTFNDGQWTTQKVVPFSQTTMTWPDRAVAVAIRPAGYGWEVGPAGIAVAP